MDARYVQAAPLALTSQGVIWWRGLPGPLAVRGRCPVVPPGAWRPVMPGRGSGYSRLLSAAGVASDEGVWPVTVTS